MEDMVLTRRKLNPMGKMRLHVAKLVDAERTKREAEGKKYTIDDIAYETRLARNTVRDWIDGDVKRYDRETLTAFCDYFKVSRTEDILEYVSDEEA